MKTFEEWWSEYKWNYLSGPTQKHCSRAWHARDEEMEAKLQEARLEMIESMPKADFLLGISETDWLYKYEKWRTSQIATLKGAK